MHTGNGYLITADAYYGKLSTAAALLKTNHHFILSCKGDYPFKKHTLSKLPKKKGSLVWTSSKKRLLALTWRDKKALNIFTNKFTCPSAARRDNNGRVIPNVISAYRACLGTVDQANAYRLRYRFQHRIFKHTRAQFMTLLGIAIVNGWVLYKHVNKDEDFAYRKFFRALIDSFACAGGNHRKRKSMAPPVPPITLSSASALHHRLRRAPVRGRCASCDKHTATHFCTGCSTAADEAVFVHQKNCYDAHHRLDDDDDAQWAPFFTKKRKTK